MSAPRVRSRTVALWLFVLAALFLLAALEWKGGGADVSAPAQDVPEQPPAPQLNAPPSSTAPPIAQQPKPTVAAPKQLPAVAPRPEDVESHCNGVGAFGICDGSVAKACVSNAVYSVDCAARHMRCVITDEGAQCLPSNPKTDCSGPEPATCTGDRLRLCVSGSFQQIDCAKRGGVCSATPAGARCASKTGTTGELGPPGKPRGVDVEVCDGRDNDADDRVDEMDVCSAVPLVAFVPSGYDRAGLELRMQLELDILNRVYAPTTFRWTKVVDTAPKYLFFDPKLMTAAAHELATSASKTFYVPVLYVHDLMIEPPKGGISTVPNEHCGGVRLSDQVVPPDGLIALTDARQPETLAHEMGHYLGLCHTHEDVEQFALAGTADAECDTNGDGVCDTPFDPGPTRCLRDDVCEIVCPEDDAQPSPVNIMSYYIGCRQLLTPEQLTEARRNLSLRRGWFDCLDPDNCECTPGAARCPTEMSCQPGSATDAKWTCRLDGPALPGSSCNTTDECARGSVCLQPTEHDSSAARCVRPCPSAQPCTCLDVGLSFQVCSDDMPGAISRPIEK